MHPADIQAELKKRGITQKEIARELGVSEFHISAAINYPEARPSDRVFKAIANKIGRSPEEVFPSYYFSPKRRTRKKITKQGY